MDWSDVRMVLDAKLLSQLLILTSCGFTSAARCVSPSTTRTFKASICWCIIPFFSSSIFFFACSSAWRGGEKPKLTEHREKKKVQSLDMFLWPGCKYIRFQARAKTMSPWFARHTSIYWSLHCRPWYIQTLSHRELHWNSGFATAAHFHPAERKTTARSPLHWLTHDQVLLGISIIYTSVIHLSLHPSSFYSSIYSLTVRHPFSLHTSARSCQLFRNSNMRSN